MVGAQGGGQSQARDTERLEGRVVKRAGLGAQFASETEVETGILLLSCDHAASTGHGHWKPSDFRWKLRIWYF